MKNLILPLLIGLFTFGIFYLFGAFAQASFDISVWSSTGREITTVVGGLATVCIIIGSFVYLKSKE